MMISNNLPEAAPKRVKREDFRKLLLVCLKMLFRKSTRTRFVCLVITFLIMMGFNTVGYVMKFHKTEEQKKVLLGEKAFKVFLLRTRSRTNFAQFFAHHRAPLSKMGAQIVRSAFIYQNNLYLHIYSPFEDSRDSGEDKREAMDLIYDLFQFRDFADGFYVAENQKDFTTKIRCQYVDYNGARLAEDIVQSKHTTIKFDLIDIADMIRENLHDRRFDTFNQIKKTIISNIERVSPGSDFEPNAYLSRVESIIPMNFLHILTNVKTDNTTDIFDLAESVRIEKESVLACDTTFLAVPERYRNTVMYSDRDIFPRYVPVAIMDLLKPRWNWLLYQNIEIKQAFMDYIEQLHFKGHYLFSYEKSNILKDRVEKLNQDIRANHINFYLTDLSMGIAFPFMISLFAFIYLKSEIAFLLMFKNKIREILVIFWLLPVALMLFVKGGILILYLAYLFLTHAGLTVQIGLPLTITFAVAAAAFYPINRWCFSQFTGNRLDLHEIHKGR